MHVIFLGKGNDCRTLLAEAVFNHLAPPGCRARRACCDQACPPDQLALALLERQGILPGRTTAEPSPARACRDELLITVCSGGKGHACRHCALEAPLAHWGVHCPSRRKTPSQSRDAELLDVYHILRARIERLLALQETGVESDRTRLLDELERIGRYLP